MYDLIQFIGSKKCLIADKAVYVNRLFLEMVPVRVRFFLDQIIKRLRNIQGCTFLDTEVVFDAFDTLMTKPKLGHPKVSGLLIDESDFRTSE